jgi:hypothetical protein
MQRIYPIIILRVQFYIMFENVELVQRILSPLFQRVQLIATCRKRDVYSKTFKSITSPIFDKLKVLTHTATHIINLSLSHRVESFIPECCQILAWMSSQVRCLMPELATEIDAAYAAIFQLLPSGYLLQFEVIEFRHCVGKNGYQHSKAWNNFITAVKACKVPYWLKDAVRRRFRNVIPGQVGSLFFSSPVLEVFSDS